MRIAKVLRLLENVNHDGKFFILLYFFWVKRVRFLSRHDRDFWKRPSHFQRFPSIFQSSECCWNCLRIFWRPLKTYNLQVTASPFRGEILQLKVKTTVLPFFYIRNNFKKYFFSRTYGKFCVSRESKVNPQRCHQMSTLWDHPRLPVPLQFEAVYIWECSRHINRIFASFWLSSNVSASEHWRNKCSLLAKYNITDLKLNDAH